jgi:hypothetical protein
MALATVLFRVPERVRRAHFAENTRLWDTLAPAAVENGFIERQEMLAPLRYVERDSAAACWRGGP